MVIYWLRGLDQWDTKERLRRDVLERLEVFPSFVTIQLSFSLECWLRQSAATLVRSVCLCKVSSCSSVWSLSLSVCAPVSLSLLLSPQISEQMQSPLPLLYQGDKIWKFFSCLAITTKKKKKCWKGPSWTMLVSSSGRDLRTFSALREQYIADPFSSTTLLSQR